MSLRAALLIYVTLPLALLVLFAAYAGLRFVERSVERRMQEDVELVARAIQPALSRALERGRPGTLQSALDSAFSINRVYGAYVYDIAGRRLAAAGRSGAPPSRNELSMLAQKESNRGEYGRLGDRRVYSFFVPLIDSGSRNVGLLQVTRREQDFESYMAGVRVHALMYSIVALALVAALVAYGHRGAVGRHLAGVIDSMRRVEAGNRDYRAPESGPREILQLATSLNAMLDGIARAEQQIESQRAAQRELDKRLKKAEKLAAIGGLAAGVAHELGAPLNVVSGAATRALRGAPRAETRDEIARIRNASQKMEKIVRQLLDFGREPATRLRTVSVARLARSAVSALDRRVEASGPEPAPRVTVDPFRFEQALTNVLRNAIQASPKGRVRVSWAEEGDSIALLVDDDGPGIPQAMRARLFEPFFTTKKPGEGTGLGLALVERIVHEHGGSINVEDSPWNGARFRIRLPSSGEKP